MPKTSDSETSTTQIIAACCQALDDKKAERLTILDLDGKSSIADWFIIATGTSEPHLRAMSQEIQRVLDEHGIATNGKASSHEGGWVVVDAFDFLIHLFTKNMREHYNLEGLWKDAERLDLEAFQQRVA